METLTNGRVVYLRRIKTGDYEHKEATVELSFILDPGDAEAEIARVGELARARAEAMVSGRPQATETPRAAKPPTVAPKVAEPKPEPPTVAPKVAEPKPEPKPEPPKVADVSGMDDIGDPTDVSEVIEAAPISDVKLVEHITHINAKVKNALAVRAIIAQFAGPPPKRSSDIPQDKRAAFLDMLNALQPAD
jgi:hypothetical protein